MPNNQLKARLTTVSGLYPQETAAWDYLCSTVPGLASPFYSLHYIRAVAGSGVDVRVCIFYQQGIICGFLPYQFRNRLLSLVKAAEPAGAEMSDYFGLIAQPEFKISPEQLLRLTGLNHFGFSHLDESQLFYCLKAEQPRIGLRIRLEGNAGQPLATLHAKKHKYFQDTERRERQLARAIGPLEFVFDVQEDRPQHLEKLISQKRAQYRSTRTKDALSHHWKRNMLHQLSEYQYETCRGVLSTLSAGDQWLASHFGIMGNGMLQYWLPVYNPDFARYAPGRLLLHRIIQASASAAIHTIDRGEGDTPSKRELANEEHRLYRGLWHNKSLASFALRGFNSLSWKLGA